MSLYLNGLKIDLSDEQFTAYTVSTPEDGDMSRLRDEYGGSWFLYREGSKVYGLPKGIDSPQTFGEMERLHVKDHLHLLATRIGEVIAEKYPERVLRRRGFIFTSPKRDLVQEVVKAAGIVHPLLGGFRILPNFKLESKIVAMRDGHDFVGLFVAAGTSWRIETDVTALVNEGLDLTGLYVVWRTPNPGQHRLAGRIGSIDGSIIRLSESFDGLKSVDATHVWLEGRKSSFAYCLKRLLGRQYDDFRSEETNQEASIFTGPALGALVGKIADYLRKQLAMQLAEDLYCSIGTEVEVTNQGDYLTVVNARPVECCFDSARSKKDVYPWRGLQQYGPFSKDTFAKKSPNILVVHPDTVQGQTEQFLRSFRDGLRQSSYASGFSRTFCLVNPKFRFVKIPWLQSAESNPGSAYRRAIEECIAANTDPRPDIAFVVVLDEHSELSANESPYLQSKAAFLLAGIPVQEMLSSKIKKQAADLQYILRDVAVAAYAKMGGTPWTVDQDLTINDELVIGMGSCEVSGSRFQERERHVGITTVFRGDGSYLLGNISKECSYEEYPQMLEEETTRILQDVKERNGWRPGDNVRVIFHTYKPLRKVEVASIAKRCTETVGSDQHVEFAFLTVSHDHPFRLLDRSQSDRKGPFVPERGTIVQIGPLTRLVCATGPALVKREGLSLPTPLLVHLHEESTYRSLDYLAEQVLRFTSLSWRSTLPARDPVTIFYSDLIAKLLARLRDVKDWSPSTLNTLLRSSRWFL